MMLRHCRTESASLEGTGITRAGQALARLCYDTLKTYGKQAVEACKVHAVTPALEAICEANVYLSGVGADNVNCAAAHSFYNGVTSFQINTILYFPRAVPSWKTTTCSPR